MALKILLFGKNGQVGWELQRALAPLGDLTALDRSGTAELGGDLEDIDRLRATIRSLEPDVIVNAAAYTAVDRAEEEYHKALRINAHAPGVMAVEAASLGALLVHYSSDYVFDGSGNRPWRESDATGPLNRYGQSKLEGEQAIRDSGCRHLIFRTSWVYGATGNNFPRTLLRLAREREQLRVIDDQVGAPTGAELLADVTAQALRSTLVNPELSGLYHLAPAGEVSWFGYASFLLEQARNLGEPLNVQSIEPIPSAAYPTPAPRPLNSRLDTTRLQRAFDLQLPPWQHGVTRMLRELTGRVL